VYPGRNNMRGGRSKNKEEARTEEARNVKRIKE
jgi:hypothetical protein